MGRDDQGGYCQEAYLVHCALGYISRAGLPVSVSVLVSSRTKEREHHHSRVHVDGSLGSRIMCGLARLNLNSN